jgi:hypothetical protein
VLCPCCASMLVNMSVHDPLQYLNLLVQLQSTHQNTEELYNPVYFRLMIVYYGHMLQVCQMKCQYMIPPCNTSTFLSSCCQPNRILKKTLKSNVFQAHNCVLWPHIASMSGEVLVHDPFLQYLKFLI